MAAKRLAPNEWRPNQFRMAGGVNEEDPQFTLKSGELAFSRNYECLRGGGYKRIAGYERYDSQASPSSATYKWTTFTTGVVEPTDQLAVTGSTSGATGVIVGMTQLLTGSFAAGDASGQVAMTAIVGAFQNGETIKRTSDNVVLLTLTNTMITMADDDLGWSSWIHGARKYLRDKIVVVPGFGSILGVFQLGGYVYAWRATAADHTKQALYKATGGAWVLQTLTGYLRYSNGVAEVLEGDTITGLVSGATAIVRRINISAGNFAGPTYCSGRFAITNITGTFQNAEALQVGGVTKANAVGTQVTASVMAVTASTRHQTVLHNFYGNSSLRRIYGVDKTNNGYEFDGTYFINVETGMANDVPQYIEVHRSHLFFVYPGGSLQNSGTGQPLTWSPRTGAAEIGLGDDPTGIMSNGNNTLAITAMNSVHILTGTSNADWNLRVIVDEIGTTPYSLAEVGGQTMFIDQGGVNVLLPAPPTFMDYSTQTVSRNIRKTIETSALLTQDTLFFKKKSQYRVFFSDKTGIIGAFNGTKLMGWTQTKYAHQITCSTSGDDTSNVERMFAGISDGYVVELDVGSSFDGEAIESILQLPFGYYGSPDRDKRFHKLTIEVETPRQVALSFGIDYDYAGSGTPGRFSTTAGSTTALSQFTLFGDLFWNTNVLSACETPIDGVGRSMGIAIYSNLTTADPYTISAGLVQITPLGVKH